jgi:hypothetical protein
LKQFSTESGGRSKEEGGRRKEEGGRRKEEKQLKGLPHRNVSFYFYFYFENSFYFGRYPAVSLALSFCYPGVILALPLFYPGVLVINIYLEIMERLVSTLLHKSFLIMI